MNKTVVTGATGNVGRPLVSALVAAGVPVTAVSRRITPRDAPGATTVAADIADPESVDVALEGASALFLLTGPDYLATGADPAELLARAGKAGVSKVVLLSSQGVALGYHPPTYEDVVRASGLKWTLLRPGGFHSNTFQWAPSIRATRTVHAPFGDIALPTIDPKDIAEVAAAALLDDAHAGQAYELTGPAPISPRAQTEALSAAIGERINFAELTREQAKVAMLQHMPEPVVDNTLDLLSTADPRVSPDVERVLHRPARPYALWANENTAAFTG